MNAIVQQFHFEPGTLIAYDGFQVVVTGPAKDGIIVRDRHVGEGENARHWVLSAAFVQELMQRLDVIIDDEFSKDAPEPDEKTDRSPTRFEDFPEAERTAAFQREAWCLAAATVLGRDKLPFTETKIVKKYPEIRALALERQKLNDLGRHGRSAQFKGRAWGAKSVSDYCKVYFKLAQPHPRALLRRKPTGRVGRRLSEAEDRLLDKCCCDFLDRSKPTPRNIIKLVKREFKAALAARQASGNYTPFQTPHENTIYRRLRRFTRLQIVVGRDGYQAAQKEFSPTHHGVRALKPGELIELDFWKGDVFTFSKRAEFWDLLTPDLQKILKDGKATVGKTKSGKAPRQRLWICVALDVATRTILGVAIAETPNAKTVIEVLDQVMRDKSDLSRLAECKMAWSQHCGLGTVIFDTGGEFFDEEVQTAILAAGGSFIYGRAGVPMDKPFVERLFGGLRTMLADELPGKTGYSSKCLVDYDREGMAAFNTEQFRHLLIRHVVDYYPLLPHAGLFGKRPIDAWNEAQKYRPVRPPQPRDRRNATGIKLTRMLTKEGIKILGVPFSKPHLPEIFPNGAFLVEVRLDPNDLREVTIIVDGQRIYLQNQRPELARHSIRTLMAAIKKMAETKPKDRVFYEEVLAQHEDEFALKIEMAIRQHGLPSTAITTEEIDAFEKSYCLKVQIVKKPGETASADLDVLLDGGTGPGIHTPEEIAAEKAAFAAAARAALDESNLAPGESAAAGTGLSHASNAVGDAPEGKSMNPRSAAPSTRGKAVSGTKTSGRFSGAPKGKGTFS